MVDVIDHPFLIQNEVFHFSFQINFINFVYLIYAIMDEYQEVRSLTDEEFPTGKQGIIKD